MFIHPGQEIWEKVFKISQNAFLNIVNDDHGKMGLVAKV